MKRIQNGFTLIELMVVVAIVGVLAVLAMPAYQDYVVRSKMSEAIAALGACKTSLYDYAIVHGGVPADASDAGCSTTSTQYVASLTVSGFTITANTINTGAGNCSVSLSPSGGGWVGSTDCPAKYVPASFRG